MIQNIIVLVIVALVVVKTAYSVYKSITTKDKSVCGGCASCDLKHELKKKGKLGNHSGNPKTGIIQYSASTLKYPAK